MTADAPEELVAVRWPVWRVENARLESPAQLNAGDEDEVTITSPVRIIETLLRSAEKGEGEVSAMSRSSTVMPESEIVIE
jgi:hypothetical protein